MSNVHFEASVEANEPGADMKISMVEALLDAGADAKVQNKDGDTPCRVARDEGHFADTPLLIRLCRP